MISEISVPLDGLANTQSEIEAAVRLAERQFECSVVGWPVCSACISPAEFARDVDSEYGTHYATSGYRDKVAGSVLSEQFLTEAAHHGVSARIADHPILDVADFYQQSSKSDLAVLSSNTVDFWRNVESNAFLQGDFRSYRTAPLLILGACADGDFQDVVIAYDGTKESRAALQAFANLELGSSEKVRILICEQHQRLANRRVDEISRLAADWGIPIAGIMIRFDFLDAVVDEEICGRSSLVVAGLCRNRHPHRPRFGHLADHLIETKAVSMLLAC